MERRQVLTVHISAMGLFPKEILFVTFLIIIQVRILYFQEWLRKKVKEKL
jgi:hypothetical protein